MSTPSTATATLPPHQPHYGYSYHQNYQANPTSSRANNPLLTGAARLGGSFTFPGSSSNHIPNGVGSANSTRLPQVTTPSIPKPKNENPIMPASQPASEH